MCMFRLTIRHYYCVQKKHDAVNFILSMRCLLFEGPSPSFPPLKNEQVVRLRFRLTARPWRRVVGDTGHRLRREQACAASTGLNHRVHYLLQRPAAGAWHQLRSFRKKKKKRVGEASFFSCKELRGKTRNRSGADYKSLKITSDHLFTLHKRVTEHQQKREIQETSLFTLKYLFPSHL